MALSKFNLILFLFIFGYTEQVISQCSNPFSSGDIKNFCYYYEKKTSLTWSDAYNQCLSKTIDGVLIEIFTIEQFNELKKANIDKKGLFWLGANNFASFRDSQWHWLDGSIVDNSVITWCPNSTYDTAVGTHCAAYDSTLQCVTNYLCSTLLPAPCVALTNILIKQGKSLLNTKSISTGVCSISYGAAYTNWWTYSIILLNWFILFCFILYLANTFNINKRTVILTVAIVIISFMSIIVFAILWGVQYQDVVQIPLIIVVLGCFASIFILITILMLISSRNRVQRWIICMIVSIITIIIECLLMLGLILCIAHCSGYISLVSTSVDKDIIAAILSGIIAAISIIFYNAILYLIADRGQDRVHVMSSNDTNPNNAGQFMATQAIIPRRSQNNDGTYTKPIIKKHEHIERATSPVDQRILKEFYTDKPKDMHEYHLEGRQYVVYEGKNFTDIEPYKKDLTQAMLLQESQGLREAIARVKSSIHASALTDEIQQAESLLNRLK